MLTATENAVAMRESEGNSKSRGTKQKVLNSFFATVSCKDGEEVDKLDDDNDERPNSRRRMTMQH